MKEVFVPVKGYEGLYEISNTGLVKSFIKSNRRKGDYLTNVLAPVGYYVTALSKDKKSKNVYIHRLLAEAFIENPNNYPFIDHINGNKQDNSISNLRWCTKKQNERFNNKINKNKSSKYVGVCYDKHWGKWKASLNINGKTKNLGTYKTEHEAYLRYKKFIETEE